MRYVVQKTKQPCYGLTRAMIILCLLIYSVKVSTDTGAVLAAYVMTRGHGSNSSWRKAEVCGRFEHVPRKIRQLVTDLEKAGFVLVPGGKGSHRKFRHPKLPGPLILSGQSGDDAKHYQKDKFARLFAT